MFYLLDGGQLLGEASLRHTQFHVDARIRLDIYLFICDIYVLTLSIYLYIHPHMNGHMTDLCGILLTH